MPSYCDPIAYGFCFRTLSERKDIPELKAAFKELLISIEDYLLSYGGFSGPPVKSVYNSGILVLFHTENNVPLNLNSRWLSPALAGDTVQDVKEYLIKALNALDDVRCEGMDVDVADRSSRRRYYKGPTILGKEYQKWLVRPEPDMDLKANREHLWRILSCPSDDLLDVRIPASGLYGDILFYVSYKQMSFDRETGEGANPKFHLIAETSTNQKKLYLHRISICIPRFLVGKAEDAAALQKQWTGILCRLGMLFPLSAGSVDMDVSHPWCITAFDAEERALGNIWLSKRIPGYAWGMLINSTQRSLLPELPKGEDEGSFYRTAELGNGNLFLQKTKDWKIMRWEDCNSLRSYFKPALTPSDLSHFMYTGFSTFRSGFTPEEMIFDGFQYQHRFRRDFAVRHCQ